MDPHPKYTLEDLIDVARAAAESGSVPVLQLVHRLVIREADDYDDETVWAEPLSIAAKRGHLPAVQYLFTRNVGGPEVVCAAMTAAEHGHVDVVAWLHAQWKCESNAELCRAVFEAARDARQTDVLAWLTTVCGNISLFAT